MLQCTVLIVIKFFNVEREVVLTSSKKIFDKMALVRNHGEAVVGLSKLKIFKIL